MINEKRLYPHRQMVIIMSLFIQNLMVIKDVYFVKQILFKKVFFLLIIFTDGCFLALKPDSWGKKQVSKSNSNLMPLVSQITG
jgi:hypothetical protein